MKTSVNHGFCTMFASIFCRLFLVDFLNIKFLLLHLKNFRWLTVGIKAFCFSGICYQFNQVLCATKCLSSTAASGDKIILCESQLAISGKPKVKWHTCFYANLYVYCTFLQNTQWNAFSSYV